MSLFVTLCFPVKVDNSLVRFCLFSWSLVVTALLSGAAAILICRQIIWENKDRKTEIYPFLQSDGTVPGKKEPNGGDFPWNSGGHVDDEQGGKEDLQLPGNSVRAATTWQPEVQEARTCQQLVGKSQLQERSEEMSSATCALSRQKIHGCWFRGLSLP